MKRSTTLERVVTYAGIDYHKKFSMITLGDAEGRVILTEQVANDRESIKRFFADYSGVQCAVESCRGYEWFVDYLKELGLSVTLSNPYQTKLIAQSRCKTDKVDSRSIMQLLAIGFLPVCYQPTPEERKLRERLRWRAHLVRHATKMKIKIHALLDKENLGLGIPRLFNSNGRKFLYEVPLSEPRKVLLTEHMNLLEYYEDMVERENAWIHQTAQSIPEVQKLLTVPGIGELTGLMLFAEMGDVSRFKRASQVAAYFGMVPSVYSSANHRRLGGLTKQGSSLVRWVVIQAAWQGIRHCYQFRVHFNAVSRRCGRNAAIVSVARKMIQIAYRVLRDNKAFSADLVGPQTN